MDNYFITGGAGFIGTNLVEEILKSNKMSRVYIYDNLSSGHAENIIIDPRVTFIWGDIGNYSTIYSALKNQKHWKAVFHLAALVSVPRSIDYPRFSKTVNIDGMFNVLTSVKNHGNVDKFIFASSAAVYGSNSNGAVKEDWKLEPLSPYAVEKLTGELYVKIFNDLYGVNGTSVRFFNVFGPRQDPSSPYSGIISKVMHEFFKDTQYGDKAKISVYGGKQTRDFIYVKNLVRYLFLISKMPKTGGEIYNIGSGESISIRKTIDEVAKVVTSKQLSRGVKGNVVTLDLLPQREGEVMKSLANIGKIEELGLDSFIDFKSFKECLEDYTDHMISINK